MSRVTIVAIAALSLLMTVPASAAIINVGDHIIDAAPGQQIPITVIPEAGDPPIAGVLLNVQISDGGPAVGGTDLGPVIQYVQLVEDLSDPLYATFGTDAFGPTIFDAMANQGHFGDGSLPAGDPKPQVYVINTATVNGAVAADGLLGIITLDGTGFDHRPGGWALHIEQTLNGPSVLSDDTPAVNPIPLTVNEGTVNIPEPSTVVMLIAGLVGLLLWRRRRV